MPEPLQSPAAEIAAHITPKLASELRDVSEYYFEDREHVLKLAKKLLVEVDLDEDIGTAIDYLQCQVDHQKNRKQLLALLEHRQSFDGEFHDLRRTVRELRESIMQNIRYGKRTEEVDEALNRLTTLMTMVNQVPNVQPAISLAGADSALSPRCSSCLESCRSAFRKVQVLLRKIIRELPPKPKDDNDS